MCKNSLRRKYRQLRNEIPLHLRQSAESVVTQRVTALKAFGECDTLFAFISTKSEVSTDGIISAAFELNKQVAVPLVLNIEKMCFIYISSLSDLKEGNFGIREPKYNIEKLAVPTEHSLMLVPGLAFDKSLNRLGYGGGFYDRYMSENSAPLKVGIGFSVQYSEEALPRDEYDLPLDILITEKLMIGV